jgi:DNA-binding NarL/FixJ family response regulator
MTTFPNGPVRVMIVEDDRITRERFARAMSADDRIFLAGAARTGHEALAMLAGARPQVLLVDLGLPDMQGIEVIRHAVRSLPDCDIMVITVFGDEAHVLGSIEAGASGYVLKDCGDEELVAYILELRRGGAPMSPGIARTVLKSMRARAEPLSGSSDNTAAVLTTREIEVLRMISRGYTYAEVAAELGVSPHTVASHSKHIYRKLAVHSAAAAVMRATRLRLLDES